LTDFPAKNVRNSHTVEKHVTRGRETQNMDWRRRWDRRRAWVRDLRSVPESRRPREQQVENHGRGCTHVLSLRKAELEFFHFLEIVRGWLVPSAGQKIPV
jgi:hypothetical protein